MIYETLTYLTGALNQEISTSLSLNEDKVVLSSLSSADGTPVQKVNEKLALFMMNLEEESTLRNSSSVQNQGGTTSYMKRPIYLNLYVMFVSNFSDYGESLKFLSYVLKFYQGYSEFTPASSPTFPDGLSKLDMELVSADYQSLSYIWGIIGMKYQPSALYKARIVTVETGEIIEDVPAIRAYKPEVTGG